MSINPNPTPLPQPSGPPIDPFQQPPLVPAVEAPALPPLPKPGATKDWTSPLYSQDQMVEYGRQCAAHAIAKMLCKDVG